jgi:hypothetical protein
MGASSVKKRSKNNRPRTDEPTPQTKEQLKAELKKRNLKTAGSKTELVF